jgi:hypothetical protein
MRPNRFDRRPRRARHGASSFLIAHHLRVIEELERHIAAFDDRIEEL